MSKYALGDKFTVTISEQFENTDGSKFFKLKGLDKVLLTEAELDKVWEEEPEDYEAGYRAGMKAMLDKLVKTGGLFIENSAPKKQEGKKETGRPSKDVRVIKVDSCDIDDLIGTMSRFFGV